MIPPPSRAPAPVRPERLPGDMWAITTCFNPLGYANKYDHLLRFSAGVRAQGLKLLVIEMAFGEQPFKVPNGVADIVLRVRSGTILWQKERLLNLAIQALPTSCDKVAWLDADLLFTNDAWGAQTSELLERYMLVQPFQCYTTLPQGVLPPLGFDNEEFADSLPIPGTAFARTTEDSERVAMAQPGGAWAARRSLLEQYGIYDRFILGGGDTALVACMYGELEKWLEMGWMRVLIPQGLADDLRRWSNDFFREIQGSVSFTPGRVLHLWHGDAVKRRYVLRLAALRDADFDPSIDIAHDENGCWRWSSDKPTLHRAVEEYFRSRREEG